MGSKEGNDIDSISNYRVKLYFDSAFQTFLLSISFLFHVRNCTIIKYFTFFPTPRSGVELAAGQPVFEDVHHIYAILSHPTNENPPVT